MIFIIGFTSIFLIIRHFVSRVRQHRPVVIFARFMSLASNNFNLRHNFWCVKSFGNF